MFVIIILAVIGIPLICWIEWIIGEAIGKSVTKGAGLVIGIILVLCGFSLFIGIPVIIYSNKKKEEFVAKANINLNTNTSYSKQEENKDYYKFIGKNFKDILTENDLSDYISIFEQNKLIDLKIISELSEDDLEKLGVTIMGDRKRIIKIFDMGNNKYTAGFTKPQPEKRIISNDPDIWNCPNCNYGNDNNLYRCKNCGYSII